MARLEKLQIQGFRSFSPDDNDPGPQKIDFVRRSRDLAGATSSLSSPLTLILGQNGCGKTTIIECLRYVTTGDCPPGSYNGRNFVHDPKMANEPTVSASVKLQYIGRNGDRYVVARCMEAKQMAKNITVKTLDGTITRKRKEDDSLQALSMKCTDINLQMFHTLGVSKPILNYVIFCHQEDANWPLDEGGKVKDKFDEIFSSAKYKECLKKIKEVRADHMQKEKIEKKELEYMSSEKIECKQKRKNLKDKENARKNMEEEKNALDEKLKPVREELMVIKKVQMDYQGIWGDMVTFESDLKNCKREISDLKPKILRLLPDSLSDDDVKKMIKEFSSKQKEIENEIENISSELKLLSEAKSKFEREQKQLMASIGQCNAFRKTNDTNSEELCNSLRQISRKLGWELTSNAGFSEEEIEECSLKIQETINQQESEKRLKIAKYDKDFEKQNEEIYKLGTEAAQLEEQKRMKGEERTKTQKSMAQIRRLLNDLQGSETKLKSLMERFEDKEAELQAVKSEVNIEVLKRKTTEKEKQIVELIKQHDIIKDEKRKIESQREIASEISIKANDLSEKQRKLNRIMASKNSELILIFGNNIPDMDEMRERFNEKRNQLSETKDELEKKDRRLVSDKESKREQRKALTKDVEQKEDRIKRFERSLQDSDLMEVDEDFEEQLQLAKDEVEKTRLELEVKQANKYTYQEFIDKINKMQVSKAKPSCPTCHRNFDNNSEATDLKRELENDIKRIPSKVNSIQNKLKKAIARLDNLQAMLPEKKQTDEMKTDVKEKSKNMVILDKAIKNIDEQLSEIEENLEVANSDYSVCEDLRDYVSSMDQLFREISSLSNTIKDLKSKAPELSSSRDYNIVKNEEENISDKITALRREVQQCQSSENEHEKRINVLERERNNLLNEKLQIEKNQQERKANQEKRQELEIHLKDCDRILGEIDQNLQPIHELIDDAKEKRSRIVKDKERNLNEIDESINEIKEIQYDVQKRHQSSIEYKNSGNEEKIERYTVEYKKLQDKVKSQEAQQSSLESEKSNLQIEASTQAKEERNLDDNVKLREYKSREVECTAKIAKYKDKLNDLEYERNEKRRVELNNSYEKLDRQIERLRGRLGELQDTIEELEIELNSDKYRLAEDRYRKKSIEARCRYHVINDLNKYYIAMDWAIMRFHQERMRVINRIIRELWRATYRGNDIDYIEIDTEDGSDLSMAGADKRKSVNYRVVMVKNETRLDMRGRCSAGQKVLASLIIRLALAETFSASCGMIALDEPTTNLDRENIESLAQALSDIVAKRSTQKNFQLIVITHDEELIDHLSRMDQVDYYYKVSRDEKGRSIIRRNLNNMR